MKSPAKSLRRRSRYIASVVRDRVDFLVENSVVVELKAVKSLLPIHEAQILSYLRLAHKRVGLLINFHTPQLKNGVKRFVQG